MSLGPDVASGALNMEGLAITQEQKGALTSRYIWVWCRDSWAWSFVHSKQDLHL